MGYGDFSGGKHLTKGASEDMDYDEYQQRRKALKQKSRQWTLGVFWGTGGYAKQYQARIEELDKLYEGEEYDEEKLHGEYASPPPLGYKIHYLSYQFIILLLFGWWTLGLANVWYHRKFKRAYPKDKRL